MPLKFLSFIPTTKLRAKHVERSEKLAISMSQAPAGSDGPMHPNRLLAALRDALPGDAIVVANGGTS